MQPPKRISRWALLGFGFVLALLVSLPVIATVTGTLNDRPRYTLMDDVPERGDGAYVRVNDGVRQGVVKLYAWNFRLNEFPADAPIFNPAHVSALIISQRGIDDPARYYLFRIDDGSTVPFDAAMHVTKIVFTPRAPLQDGNYMLDMPKSGLSSDRQYLYFRLDSGATGLPVEWAQFEMKRVLRNTSLVNSAQEKWTALIRRLSEIVRA